MAMASRTRSRSDVPVCRRKRSAAAAARGKRSKRRRPFDASHHLRVDHPLGRAVESSRDDRVGHRRREVARLHHVGHPGLGSEEEAGTHGDPVGTVRQRGHQAAAIVEATGTEDRDVRPDGVDDLWQKQRRRHRSCVPAPLAALGDDRIDAHGEHLLRVTAGADGGHHEHACVVAARDGVLVGGAREADQPHAGVDHERDPLGRSGWSARKFTPNGASVRFFTSATAWCSSSTVIVTAARIPNPPAALVAAVRGAPRPSPCRSARPAVGNRRERRTSSEGPARADLTLRQARSSAPPRANACVPEAPPGRAGPVRVSPRRSDMTATSTHPPATSWR